MAKKSMIAKQKNITNIQHKNITDVKFVVDHMVTLENMEFAVYALEN